MTCALIGLALCLSTFAALALWMLVSIHRINAPPDDDYPVSRNHKGEWDQ